MMPGSRFRIRPRRLSGLLLALAAAAVPNALGSAADQAAVLAIRAELLLPISGPPVEDAVVLVRDGRIAAAGAGVSVPAGARELRAAVVMPGLIDAHSHLGVQEEREEPVDAVTPDLRVRDALDPFDPAFERAVRAGVTAALVAPGNGNVFGGQASVVRLTPAPEVLLGYAAQKLSVSSAATDSQRNPTSRAGLLEVAGAALRAARDGQGSSSALHPHLLLGTATTLAERGRALQPVAEGERLALIHAPRADDAEHALLLSEEFGLNAALVHASGAAPLAERLAARGVPVVLGPFRLTDGERSLASAAALAEAGVALAFCTDAPLADPASLRLTAHLAVRHGLEPETALRALTLDAARLLGIVGRVGSVEAGKEADLLLLSGDPLDLTSRVEAVIAGGRLVPERAGRGER